MAEDFSFEEISSIDWLKSVTQKTDKQLYYTNSQPSQQILFHEIFDPIEPGWNINDFNQKAHLKARNKNNAKNYRERKKNLTDLMKRKIQQLEAQNLNLKKNRYCKWCQKPFEPFVKCKTDHINIERQLKKQKFYNKSSENEMELQYEKPKLLKTERSINSKVWIALGILMLILGITMHGLDGDEKYIRQIQLQKQETSQWIDQFKKADKLEDFKIKMRFRFDRLQNKNQFGRKQSQSIAITYVNTPETPTFDQRDEEVSINKQLLYGIHAEIEDIGVYL